MGFCANLPGMYVSWYGMVMLLYFSNAVVVVLERKYTAMLTLYYTTARNMTCRRP